MGSLTQSHLGYQRRIYQTIKMKFYVFSLLLVVISAQVQADHAHHTHDHYSPPVETYPSTSYSDSYYPTTSYDSPDVDMDVILPIVVFGGLGLGALAYIETLNSRNQLCNKVRELTNVARANAATGTATANLVAAGGTITPAIATNVNNIINGNRDF